MSPLFLSQTYWKTRFLVEPAASSVVEALAHFTALLSKSQHSVFPPLEVSAILTVLTTL